MKVKMVKEVSFVGEEVEVLADVVRYAWYNSDLELKNFNLDSADKERIKLISTACKKIIETVESAPKNKGM